MNTTTHERSTTPSTQNSQSVPQSRDEAERFFQNWIDEVFWKFAKTYAHKAPHEYTITTWRPELDATFKQFVQFIRDHGQVDLYHGHPFTVYYLNGWKYWTMGEAVEETELVNRTCEEWCRKFNLTWNPPAGFQSLKPVAEKESDIVTPSDTIRRTPCATMHA